MRSHYTVILEPADDGSLSVWVPDLPNCVSTGDKREEALANIADATRSNTETLRALGQPVPAPLSSADSCARREATHGTPHRHIWLSPRIARKDNAV